jgi:hypothetical protein
VILQGLEVCDQVREIFRSEALGQPVGHPRDVTLFAVVDLVLGDVDPLDVGVAKLERLGRVALDDPDEQPAVLRGDHKGFITVGKPSCNRVVAVHRTVVLGTQAAVDRALAVSVCSRTINTSFVKRQHGTAQGRNARQSRKTYRFSKDWEVHEAIS